MTETLYDETYHHLTIEDWFDGDFQISQQDDALKRDDFIRFPIDKIPELIKKLYKFWDEHNEL